MSNLSELLPAGSSVKSADFVAQGTLASGVTVGLRSDGKVEAISGVTQVIGSGSAYFQASSSNNYAESAYDTANDKVVVVYRAGGNNDYGSAVVGTVSGNTISWGTPVVFSSSSTRYTSIAFDSSNNKSVIAYAPLGDSSRGTAIVGTVSGTSISFGSPTVFDSGFNMEGSSCVFDTSNNKVVIAYDYGNGPAGKAIVGTVSGTGISFGSATTFMTVNPTYIDATFDSNSNKVVVTYKNSGSNQYLYVIVGTVSGTSISFGTPVVMSSANNFVVKITFDSVANKVIGVYGTGGLGDVVVGTVSGTSISFGTPVPVIPASATGINQAAYGVTFDPIANKVVILFQDGSNSPYSTYLSVGTVSGTSISMEAPVLVSNQNNNELSAVYDPDSNKVVGVWRFGTTGGQGAVITIGSTNATSFIGITDQAISSAATGKVVCKGGVSTGATAQTLPPVLGAQSTIVSNAYYVNSAYDSTTKNTVFQFYDSSNSGYGTARVASISGTTLTYGSPVVYYSAGSDNGYLAYDSNANKVVIVYRGAPSYYAYAVVGTVSGTSISFGTPVAITSANAIPQAIIFDSSSNKVVIAYKEGTAGKAVVGTVSGTSISFGSIVQFVANVNQSSIGLAYDSTNNKTVLLYANTDSSNNPTAAVGTVSGTSISFGSAVVINGSASAGKASITFDPSSGKVVVAYDQNSQSYVGTVSGTSISFGSVVSYNGGTAATYNYLTVDTVTNNVVLFYDNNSTNGKYVYGTVSGTSIAWSTPAAVTATRPTYGGISFNVNSKLVIMSFRLDSPQGGYVVPLSLSTVSEPFTIGSNYFVQDGGTLSTSSTSTKAGTALSTTSLLITG